MAFKADWTIGNFTSLASLVATVCAGIWFITSLSHDIDTLQRDTNELVTKNEKVLKVLESHQQDLTVIAQTIATDKELASTYADLKIASDGINK